jgi:hypothetical protein
MSDAKTLPSREAFQKFERVRRSGRFNMFDPSARRETGLSSERYSAVMKHYEELVKLYPDVRKGS